jgi:hypothetical protein
MKNWAFVLGAAAAVGTAAVVAALVLKRNTLPAGLEDISDILTDCHDRLHRIEADLHRLKPELELAS